MAVWNSTEPAIAIQQADKELSEIDFDLLNQKMALDMSPLIEAVMNMLVIAYSKPKLGTRKNKIFLRPKLACGDHWMCTRS